MPREIDSEPSADQAERMMRLGFESVPTSDTVLAVWRHGPLEISLPARRSFANDGEACAVIISQAIDAGRASVQASLRRTLGIREHS